MFFFSFDCFFVFNLFFRACSTIHCLPINLSFLFSFIREKARVSNSSLPEVRKNLNWEMISENFVCGYATWNMKLYFHIFFYVTVTYDIDPLTFREMSAIEWLRCCNAVTTPNCHKTFVDQRPCWKTPYLSKAKLYALIITFSL